MHVSSNLSSPSHSIIVTIMCCGWSNKLFPSLSNFSATSKCPDESQFRSEHIIILCKYVLHWHCSANKSSKVFHVTALPGLSAGYASGQQNKSSLQPEIIDVMPADWTIHYYILWAIYCELYIVNYISWTMNYIVDTDFYTRNKKKVLHGIYGWTCYIFSYPTATVALCGMTLVMKWFTCSVKFLMIGLT